MKLTNSGFQRGYNPIVVEGDASDMNMDFGELLMEKGDMATRTVSMPPVRITSPLPPTSSSPAALPIARSTAPTSAPLCASSLWMARWKPARAVSLSVAVWR